MLLLSFVIILQSLCSPNEDFGRPNQHCKVQFRSTFQRFVTLKVLRSWTLQCWFGLPKSSFGAAVGNSPLLERISYGLGQRYHYFDEISLLFETTRQHFRPRYVVLAIAELPRTITRFHQNDDNVVQAMRTFQTIRQNCQPRIQVEISR